MKCETHGTEMTIEEVREHPGKTLQVCVDCRREQSERVRAMFVPARGGEAPVACICPEGFYHPDCPKHGPSPCPSHLCAGEKGHPGTCPIYPQVHAAPAAPQASVGGERMEVSIADHVRRCEALIAEEQARPLPNNALIAALCDSVRLTREVNAAPQAPGLKLCEYEPCPFPSPAYRHWHRVGADTQTQAAGPDVALFDPEMETERLRAERRAEREAIAAVIDANGDALPPMSIGQINCRTFAERIRRGDFAGGRT